MTASLADFDEFMVAHGPGCSAAAALGGLDKQQRANVEAALEGGYPVSAVARTMSRKYGQPVSAYTLNRHLRGDCKCQTKT